MHPRPTHHVGATLHGAGGALLRVDAQVPRGYRIVLRDRARYLTGGLRFEIVRGTGRHGVLSIDVAGALPYFVRRDPAYPSLAQSAFAVADSYHQNGLGRVRRVARDRYLIMRGVHPVAFTVAMTGPMPLVVFGRGWGRPLLADVAGTLVVRWRRPDPGAVRSDPAALALRDRANAAISRQDSYSRSDTSPAGDQLVDVDRAGRYQAVYFDGSRGAVHVLTVGGFSYDARTDPDCWERARVVDNGQFLAPRLPVEAIGLRYARPRQVGRDVRVSYRYWTSSGVPAAGSVDLDPTTMLPVRTTDDAGTSRWTWGPVARVGAPSPTCHGA